MAPGSGFGLRSFLRRDPLKRLQEQLVTCSFVVFATAVVCFLFLWGGSVLWFLVSFFFLFLVGGCSLGFRYPKRTFRYK